jgi:hypothetical protein
LVHLIIRFYIAICERDEGEAKQSAGWSSSLWIMARSTPHPTLVPFHIMNLEATSTNSFKISSFLFSTVAAEQQRIKL